MGAENLVEWYGVGDPECLELDPTRFSGSQG